MIAFPPTISPINRIIVHAQARTALFADRAFHEARQQGQNPHLASEIADLHATLLTKVQAQENGYCRHRAKRIEELAIQLAELDPTFIDKTRSHGR